MRIKNRFNQLLITKAQWLKLLANAAASETDDDHDPKPVVKWFGGSAGTWLFTEARVVEGDVELYGLCDPGAGYPEIGYASAKELIAVRFPPLGLPIERDRYFKPNGTLSQYADVASKACTFHRVRGTCSRPFGPGDTLRQEAGNE